MRVDVQPAQPVKLQGSAGLAERQIPRLIQNDGIQAQHAVGNAPGLALPFAVLDLVHGCVHVVIDAARCNPAQGSEGAGMGVEQHFVAPAG